MQFRNTKHQSESAVDNTRSHYYIIQTMKRSAAPSNTHPSGASKKMKPTKVVESSIVNKEIMPLKVVAKSGPPPPINAKQQKAFHHLLSAAAYNSVLEGNTDSTDGLRELCARYYHGFDEDNIGIAASFLQGDGRFGVLWDDNVIAQGFGHLSGLSHAQLSYYILRPTLRGKNLITGRQILEKGRACLMEAKKMLALWVEFLIDGQMPSGMNENNALQHVLKRARALTSNEVVEDEVNDEDIDDQGDQGASGKNFFISDFCMHFNILFDIWIFSQSPLMLLYF